ncbi:MAG: hypothetical protein V1754_02440 [Pseudomonadota bacterium]
MKKNLLLLVCCCMFGCFVSPFPEDNSVQMVFSVGISGKQISAQTSADPWDSKGLFLLEKFPKYVRIAVEVEDYELEKGTWPDPKLGIGTGEGPNGEVEVQLTVPAGVGRRIRALGFLAESNRVLVYKEARAKEMELVAGGTLDVAVDMVAYESGSVRIVVRCEEGKEGPWIPDRLSLIDLSAQVLHPALNFEGNGEGAYLLDISPFPVGRTYWARIYQKNGKEERSEDLRETSLNMLIAGENKNVALTVPCN